MCSGAEELDTKDKRALLPLQSMLPSMIKNVTLTESSWTMHWIEFGGLHLSSDLKWGLLVSPFSYWKYQAMHTPECLQDVLTRYGHYFLFRSYNFGREGHCLIFYSGPVLLKSIFSCEETDFFFPSLLYFYYFFLVESFRFTVQQGTSVSWVLQNQSKKSVCPTELTVWQLMWSFTSA